MAKWKYLKKLAKYGNGQRANECSSDGIIQASHKNE